MTNQVIHTCDSVVGGASGEDKVSFQVFPDSVDRIPKLSRRVPSIVVEQSDGDDVESGELRWPPDDVSGDTEDHNRVTGGPVEEAEPQEQVMDAV
ncbi:protein LBH-like [Amphiprion ocellaris]|uniref:LBH domain-containing protein n=1 Tax=Amphiprion ocellaris TaxID=80972 RepID=A0AAQ5ZQ90_AMPOC|nr:protein LBH-like [Amphiprion ocellaris]